MADEERIILDVCELLERVKKWKWRNTSALARELQLDEEVLLPILAREAAKPDRRIRYHPLPSRNRLDILWRLAAQRATDDESTADPALRRTDSPDSQRFTPEVDAQPAIFLSHNQADASAAVALHQLLSGDRISTWLFELHIEHDATIIPAVREALEACRALLLYVSAAALGSTWVRKEFDYALRTIERPALVVLDGADAALLAAFGLAASEQADSSVEAFLDTVLERTGGATPDSWRRIAQGFAYEISDHLHAGGAMSVFPPPEPVALVEQVNYVDIAGWCSRFRTGSESN